MKEPSKTSTGLSTAKRELLARLLKEKGIGAAQPEMIPRRSRPEEPCVLSFAQERIWFFEQLEPGTAVYNVPTAVRLKGQLDTPALERSLNEIVRRHESLRTIFLNVEGTPKQAVAPAQPLTLETIDLAALAALGSATSVRGSWPSTSCVNLSTSPVDGWCAHV